MADARTGSARLPGLAPLLAAQIAYQLRLLSRTPRALLAGLLLPGLLLALRIGHDSHPGSSLVPLVAGLTVFGVVSTAYVTHASGLVTAREDGILRRWRATPLPSWGYFTGRMAATVLLAGASGIVIMGVGATMVHVRLGPGMALSLLVVITAGALAWAACGTAVTAFIPTTDSAWPLLAATYLPVILLSGVFGPVGGPGWLAILMRWLPAQPMIDAAAAVLRHAGGGVPIIPGRDICVLAGWAIAGLVASVRFFRWDPHRPAHARRQV